MLVLVGVGYGVFVLWYIVCVVVLVERLGVGYDVIWLGNYVDCDGR